MHEESNNLILPQINTKLKTPVQIIPTTGHTISLYKIAPKLYNLSLITSSLPKTLFTSCKHNEIISLNTFEQQLFIFNQLQNPNNTKMRIEGDFEMSFLYTSIITIIFIIVSIIFIIFGLSLCFEINQSSISLKHLKPPVSYRDLGILENNVYENNPTKSSPTQLNSLNTLV